MVMSIRSIRDGGMLLTSTTAVTPSGTMRWPSSRTRLRFEPRPRRSTLAEPLAPLLTAAPILGTAPGRSRISSSAETGCWSSISSWLTTWIGLDCSRFGLRMREPVTTICSPPWPAVSAWAVGRPGPARPGRKRARRRGPRRRRRDRANGSRPCGGGWNKQSQSILLDSGLRCGRLAGGEAGICSRGDAETRRCPSGSQDGATLQALGREARRRSRRERELRSRKCAAVDRDTTSPRLRVSARTKSGRSCPCTGFRSGGRRGR